MYHDNSICFYVFFRIKFDTLLDINCKEQILCPKCVEITFNGSPLDVIGTIVPLAQACYFYEAMNIIIISQSLSSALHPSQSFDLSNESNSIFKMLDSLQIPPWVFHHLQSQFRREESSLFICSTLYFTPLMYTALTLFFPGVWLWIWHCATDIWEIGCSETWRKAIVCVLG